MRNLLLVLGDQLDHQSLLWQHSCPAQDAIWMAEVSGESLAPASSKQRTVLFLSAMRHFAQQLQHDGWTLHYRSLDAQPCSLAQALGESLQQLKPEAVRCVLPGDYSLQQQLSTTAQAQGYAIEWLADQHFIARPGEFSRWVSRYQQPRMEHWYRYLRKDRNILMDTNGKPAGGQWNFDKDNRRSFGRNGPGPVPPPRLFEPDSITRAVIDDVQHYLPSLPGQPDNFGWPVCRADALAALEDFIEHRLILFGDYQDAMWSDQPWLYHARLSSSLNLKLLHPLEVIEAAINAWQHKHAPLNAVEGFVRQVLGWREYVRGLYWQHRKDWSQFNALAANAALPDFYWDGKTAMYCLQQSITQVLQQGYGHHIQRLMVTGLYALLLGVEPQQVHHWYLAMYVDAVDWVEVPNTVGMSQYADGGIVGSKPYIASGAYIDRMSDYCRHCAFKPKQASGDDACPFTTLYWHFIYRHQALIGNNPRLAMQLKNWQRKSTQEQQTILQRSQQIIASDLPDTRRLI
ncbi:MAG: cryptochrome/photolyase family protein [Marinobacterium sp.]|nr:cryptochrome/photolyase family protein [Marinobacterium sp.]